MKPKAHDNAKRWVKAQVEKRVDVRSYTVRTEDSRKYRWNRRYLPKGQESFIPDRAPAVIEPSPSVALFSPHITVSSLLSSTSKSTLLATNAIVHAEPRVSVSPAKTPSNVSVHRSRRLSKLSKFLGFSKDWTVVETLWVGTLDKLLFKEGKAWRYYVYAPVTQRHLVLCV